MRILPLVLLSISQVTYGIDCQNPDSDLDGDGWGWENNSSCRVAPPPDNNDIPTCKFPGISDPDGDGWGWEDGMSCKIGVVDPGPTANLFASELNGQWHCTTRNPTINGNEARYHSVHDFGLNYSMLSDEQVSRIQGAQVAGSYHFPTITGWNTQPQVQCGSKCADNYDGSRNYSFSKDGSATIEQITHGGYWQGIEYVSWSVDNYQLTVGGEDFQKFAFENFQGNAYMHLYISDSKRWTCKKQ